MSKRLMARRGDTLIEVVFAIVIFALVSVMSIGLMNKGIATSQASLEVVMARNEIDAQAEALRFIQNSFLAERELAPDQQQYVKIWRKITGDLTTGGYAIIPDNLSSFNVGDCNQLYQDGNDNYISDDNAFILNTRMLQPSNANIDYNDYFDSDDGAHNYGRLIDDMIVQSNPSHSPEAFQTSPVYPRIIYTFSGVNSDQNSGAGSLSESANEHMYRKIARAEGIWIIAVKGGNIYANGQSEYYDFHIRTCWNAVGRSTPTTIGTIVRLYNPEVIEIQEAGT
jgi:type II secretory pathway pseudopilin PulG